MDTYYGDASLFGTGNNDQSPATFNFQQLVPAGQQAAQPQPFAQQFPQPQQFQQQPVQQQQANPFAQFQQPQPVQQLQQPVQQQQALQANPFAQFQQPAQPQFPQLQQQQQPVQQQQQALQANPFAQLQQPAQQQAPVFAAAPVFQVQQTEAEVEAHRFNEYYTALQGQLSTKDAQGKIQALVDALSSTIGDEETQRSLAMLIFIWSEQKSFALPSVYRAEGYAGGCKTCEVNNRVPAGWDQTSSWSMKQLREWTESVIPGFNTGKSGVNQVEAYREVFLKEWRRLQSLKDQGHNLPPMVAPKEKTHLSNEEMDSIIAYSLAAVAGREKPPSSLSIDQLKQVAEYIGIATSGFKGTKGVKPQLWNAIRGTVWNAVNQGKYTITAKAALPSTPKAKAAPAAAPAGFTGFLQTQPTFAGFQQPTQPTFAGFQQPAQQQQQAQAPALTPFPGFPQQQQQQQVQAPALAPFPGFPQQQQAQAPALAPFPGFPQQQQAQAPAFAGFPQQQQQAQAPAFQAPHTVTTVPPRAKAAPAPALVAPAQISPAFQAALIAQASNTPTTPTFGAPAPALAPSPALAPTAAPTTPTFAAFAPPPAPNPTFAALAPAPAPAGLTQPVTFNTVPPPPVINVAPALAPTPAVGSPVAAPAPAPAAGSPVAAKLFADPVQTEQFGNIVNYQ